MTDVETCSVAVEGVSLEDRGSSSPAPQEGDHDSGVDESTQAKEPVTKTGSIQKSSSRTGVANTKRISSSPTSPSKGPVTGASSKTPMNKVQVGCAPSPNLKTVSSKIGSMANASYKPGGGNVKIESQKVKIEAKSKVGARNDNYVKSGGDKKIETVKLQWNAKSKIGSMNNATYKPGGGDKKIESRKLDFKDKAKSKVGSTANIKHAPGGGNVKIFDDKEYLRQRGESRLSKASSSKANSEGGLSGTQTPDTPEHELTITDDGEEAVFEDGDNLQAEINESEEIADDQENDAIIIELDGQGEADAETDLQHEAIPEVDEPPEDGAPEDGAPAEESAPADAAVAE